MRRTKLIGLATIFTLILGAAWAGDVPRSARLVKDSGNQFLAAKKYADAIDCYFQALEIYPEFAEAHYNLGVSFFKGYKAMGLARHHFDQYLRLAPDAPDYDNVLALSQALASRAVPMPKEPGQVVGTIAGRLLVSGANWAKPGDRIEVAEKGDDPCACLLAEYIYPDGLLTQRIWDEETLDKIKPGLVAANLSDRLLPQ